MRTWMRWRQDTASLIWQIISLTSVSLINSSILCKKVLMYVRLVHCGACSWLYCRWRPVGREVGCRRLQFSLGMDYTDDTYNLIDNIIFTWNNQIQVVATVAMQVSLFIIKYAVCLIVGTNNEIYDLSKCITTNRLAILLFEKATNMTISIKCYCI